MTPAGAADLGSNTLIGVASLGDERTDRCNRFPVRVYYEDTDLSGAVYHAGYLRFMERGRTELLRGLGVFHSALHAEPTGAVHFIVRHMTIDFRRQALMDDLLTVETNVSSVGGAAVVLMQRVLRGKTILAEATVKVAAVAGGKARRLPSAWRERLLVLAGERPAPEVAPQ